ncbi:T9SS type A sorting domain-containing protein [uncultured Draconibacterium sp.]|uniref:T9SS type A sorting domain-containing protein n=1 Tax=uncultured Draconibacterium sp. TaxID=1573823 RepID=UPI003217DC34
MKKILLIIILLVSISVCFAQQVISSAGVTQQAGEYELSWTIGETAIESISNETTILTQGFHQSKITVTAINDLLLSGLELKVYPNPTTEFVHIQMSSTDKQANYALYDFAGKLLQKAAITGTETQLNLHDYTNGTYLLRMTYDENQPLQTFKIVKR